MKKILIAVIVATISLMAVDYSQMTLEELTEMRGTIAVENREAFRAEMQSRLEAMTPEEQAAFREERSMGNSQGVRDGSGSGGMNKGSGGQGQGMRQRVMDGSGSGGVGQGRGKNN